MLAGNIDFQAIRLREALASPGYIFGASVALLTIYFLGKIIYNLYFHPLSKYPGPKLYAATYFPQVWHVWHGNEYLAFKALHDEYGKVVRIAPDALSYIGAQASKDIYGYRIGMRQIPKDKMIYSRVGGGGVKDIIIADDTDHSRFRRTLSHAFSDKALRSSEPILNTYFDLLISQLRKRASSPQTSTVDLTGWYNFCTFDIIGDLAFGESFHALENGAYHPYISAIFDGLRIGSVFRLTRYFYLENVAFRTFKFLSTLSAKARKGVAAVQRGYAKEIIAKRLSEEGRMEEKQDFMYHILRQTEEKGMTREELEANAGLLVLAGSETTATFLSGTTYHLLKTPDALQKLTDEVRGAFKTRDEITLASTVASQMPYLHAVLEEGLRMYPPVANILPRRTAEGTMIDGQYVPPNTAIGVAPWATTRSTLLYHNPFTFVPERWLPTPPPAYANDQLDAHQPFSIGPRNCLGKNLAYGEMRCILARMVWEFDMKLGRKVGEKGEDGEVLSEGWDRQKVYGLWARGSLWVELGVRKGVDM